MERSISTRPRREATRGEARRGDARRRDATRTRRIGSGRVGSPRSSRPRSANGYTDTIVAIAPPRDTPVYRYGLTPVHTFPFHFLSARDPLRASERARDFSRPHSPRRPLLPPPLPLRASRPPFSSLPPSLSLILFSSVAPSIAAESYGLTRSYDFSGRVLGHLFSYLEKRPLSTIRRRFCVRVRARATREKGEESPSAPNETRRDETRSGSRSEEKETEGRSEQRERRKKEGGGESGTRGS